MDKYKGQLGKAQVQIEHQQADYKSLEQKFLSVKSQSEQLSEKQKELSAVIDTLSQEKSDMNAENEKLKNEVEQLKKIKADAEKAKQAKQEQVKSAEKKSSSSSTVSAGGYENWRKINVQATAYSTYEAGDKLAGQWQGLTATGTSVRWGVIAVDPSVIPLGSKVYIPQFNQTFTAEDTGNAIKGNIIDIFMNTNSQANDWGRRNIEIYVQP
ncbi:MULTISPECIES: 3D domain-containing protein [Bacillus cereus group]|uniref:3D domain-containing protein n=1 Tax=Bacillus cereus group TaxID=86661 RepID=UPI001EFA1A5E|nr:MULTISPECIES: 3D domain-containing protein [Bacillus cereus group]MCM0006196.1 3D domain-containing protein [Bacillus paranthracis]MDX5884992.1 3D domain-containing protein [Bacillus cereus group sp. BfR-BA-00999]